MRNRSFVSGIFIGCLIGSAIGLFFNFNWIFVNKIGNWVEHSFMDIYNKIALIPNPNDSMNNLNILKKDTVFIPTLGYNINIKPEVLDDQKKDTVYVYLDSNVKNLSEDVDVNYDSQMEKASLFNENFLEKNIIVAKDELLTSKRVTIDNYNQNPLSSRYDSLLIENYSKNNNEFVIEFWISPIKYKGYRMNKNKIVLYGIYQYDSVFFMAEENKLFMNYQNQYYYLENSSDFNDFKPLKDLKVISQIKRK